MISAKFSLRPKRGDEWEVRLPGKPRIVKIIGNVRRMYISRHDAVGKWVGNQRIMYVDWYRLPKGRYSGIRVKELIKYGRRLRTRAERQALQDQAWDEMAHRRGLRRPAEKT